MVEILHNLWPDEATAGEIVYPIGSKFGPRHQNNLQMVMLHSGSMRLWVDGHLQYAEAARVCLLLPGHSEYFEFSKSEPTHHSWLHSYIPQLPAATLQQLAALPWSLPLSPAMTGLTRQALQLRAAVLPTSTQMLQALASQMLWLYIGEAQAQSTVFASYGEHPALSQAVRFIQAHLSQPLTLQNIAAAASFSPAHLLRLFRASFNTTVMNYVWGQRIRLGLELLAQTGLSIGEIAERCGFQTSYHFSRRVRQSTNLNPTQIRLRHWADTKPDSTAL